MRVSEVANAGEVVAVICAFRGANRSDVRALEFLLSRAIALCDRGLSWHSFGKASVNQLTQHRKYSVAASCPLLGLAVSYELIPAPTCSANRAASATASLGSAAFLAMKNTGGCREA
jgi:hypothetical protein